MSLNLRLILIGILAAGALFAGWRFVELVAAGRVTQSIETHNQEDRDAADAASEARAGVRACYDGGGVWDRAKGQCIRPLPGTGK